MATLNVLRKKSARARAGIVFQIDMWLALTVAGLVVIGMLMVYSTTFDYGLRFHDEAIYFLKRQSAALIIGTATAIAILQFDYTVLRRLSVPFMAIVLLLLVGVLIVGEQIFGARRGLIAGSLQPSELAKLATILYVAHWLSSKGERIKQLSYGLVPFSFITGIVCALIVLQPDLGTSGLIALVAFTLFFMAGADLRQFTIAGALGAGSFGFLVTVLPHAAARIEMFKLTLKDPVQAGWHIQQSVVALGTGGWFGVGLGESTQKFGPLPAAHTDGVFAILGEELGLIGCLIVIFLFGALAWRGMRTAARARTSYGTLLALGITFWLVFQALINLAVVTAVMPFTGMPLPFLSYGGSSLALSLIGVGILLNISRDARMDVKMQPQKGAGESYRETSSVRRRNGWTHLSGTSRGR
ncbi:MAG: putative lipid II flippase FtsW [Candidatus Promineifilaceae bacterium]|nr:putative lipid II flippase FtsW [Candidatus Promineifilaceae bacterium]